MVDAAVAGDPIVNPTFVPSPDARASVQIQLITDIVITGIDEGQEDLNLNFLTLRQQSIAALQRLLPELVEVSADLVNAQTILGLASTVERTRSEANKTRVVNAINGRGEPFLRGLERYRTTADRVETDDQKITALLNYFDFGTQIYQFDFLKTASLNSMCTEYLRTLPLINKIDDFSNKLIFSKISKADAYTFASELQDCKTS